MVSLKAPKRISTRRDVFQLVTHRLGVGKLPKLDSPIPSRPMTMTPYFRTAHSVRVGVGRRGGQVPGASLGGRHEQEECVEAVAHKRTASRLLWRKQGSKTHA